MIRAFLFCEVLHFHVARVKRINLAEAPRRRETAESHEGFVGSDRRWEGLKPTEVSVTRKAAEGTRRINKMDSEMHGLRK